MDSSRNQKENTVYFCLKKNSQKDTLKIVHIDLTHGQNTSLTKYTEFAS